MRCAMTIAALAMLAAPPVMSQELQRGEALYQRYCATCHGIDAAGHGPMRPVLTVQPIDLTRLAAENAGVFPLMRVVKRIDGREPLVSHGSPMPVYGDLFEGQDVSLTTETGQPVLTSEPMASLIIYLSSLQTD